MLAVIFSADQWQTAERWNNGWLFIIAVLILIIVIHLLIIGLYVREHWKWFVIVPFLLICLGLAGYSWQRTYNAANALFNRWEAKVTPQIRTKKASLFGLTPLMENEIRPYQSVNDYPTLTSLPMYTRRQVIAPVTYLGRDAYASYFEFRGLVYRFTGQLRTGKQAALIGYRFYLKDRGYTRLGFVDPVKTFTAALMVPVTSMAHKYTPSEQVVTLESMDGEWTTEKLFHN